MLDPDPILSVVGLGKLGAPLAACLAAGGFTTIGVDLDRRVVGALEAGRAPVQEPRLDALVRACGARLSARVDAVSAAGDAAVTFIAVPTPSEADGRFSTRHVLVACEQIGHGIRLKAGPHLVVLTSTVVPGATDGAVREALERASGRRVGADLGLCYHPVFVALGRVIRDLRRPDLVLIGHSQPEWGRALAVILRAVCENDPPVLLTNLVNAELVKLGVNAFLTAKITFANVLARICERIPGAEVDVVTRGMGLDPRIGAGYLTGAVAYGGPCFPRDNLALAALAREVGAPAAYAEVTDALNRGEAAHLAALVESARSPGGTVAILGLSYKPDTSVTDESAGLHLARRLAAHGIAVLAYDPGVAAAGDAAPHGVPLAPSLEACVRAGDVIVIATPWPDFAQLDPSWLVRAHTRPVIIDCWRLLAGAGLAEVADYRPLGVGPVPGARAGSPPAHATMARPPRAPRGAPE
jgi:UDPglucose 6-dehydrogenase